MSITAAAVAPRELSAARQATIVAYQPTRCPLRAPKNLPACLLASHQACLLAHLGS